MPDYSDAAACWALDAKEENLVAGLATNIICSSGDQRREFERAALFQSCSFTLATVSSLRNRTLPNDLGTSDSRAIGFKSCSRDHSATNCCSD